MIETRKRMPDPAKNVKEHRDHASMGDDARTETPFEKDRERERDHVGSDRNVQSSAEKHSGQQSARSAQSASQAGVNTAAQAKRKRSAYRKLLFASCFAAVCSSIVVCCVILLISRNFAAKDHSQVVYQTIDTADGEKTVVSPVIGVDAVAAALPSIVTISRSRDVTYNTYGGTTTYKDDSAGSGVVVAKDDAFYYIATNEHVLGVNPEDCIVRFIDGSTAKCTVKGEDPAHDLAVLSVSVKDLPASSNSVIKVAEIGDSSALKLGEDVYAIGNALGYGITITKGVISAKNREVVLDDNGTGVSISNVCLQTDAAINHGNSGGALINLAGEVVGINEIKYSKEGVEGISYAIPMEDAEALLFQMIERKVVPDGEKGFLGVKGLDVDNANATMYKMPRGVLLTEVVSGSPADDAGFVAGDIILSIDGTEITTKKDLDRMIGYYAAGDTITISYAREDGDKGYKQESVSVTLEQRR